MDAETALPTCYRHPDRETRLSCTACGRPICVDCLHTAAVGQRCGECAAPSGRSRVITADDLRAGGRAAAPFSYGVIAVAVAVFAVTFLLPDIGRVLFAYGRQANELVGQGQWWRLLSATLLHAGLMHVAFNMYALYLFGPVMEREVGTVPFAALYVAGALAGGAAYYLADPTGQAVGASGAIFALFGAWLAAAIRSRHTTAGRANLKTLLVLLGINLAISFLPGIAWQAHLGGFVAGFAIAGSWLAIGRGPAGAAARTAVAAGVGVAALAAVVLL